MIDINSQQNDRVKWATALHLKKYRDEAKAFLVEGREPVLDAIKNGWKIEALFALQDDKAYASVPPTKAFRVTPQILEKITKKTNPQPVVAAFQPRLQNYLPEKYEQTILPVLEEVRDGGNLGTIMRSCHALGLKKILLVGNCCDPFAVETIRASMGSFAHVELIHMSHDEFLAWYRHNPNKTLIGTDVNNAKDYRQMDYHGALLLLGNEQKGLSVQLRDLCRERVKIPMPGGTESLNLAIATTLLLYEAAQP